MRFYRDFLPIYRRSHNPCIVITVEMRSQEFEEILMVLFYCGQNIHLFHYFTTLYKGDFKNLTKKGSEWTPLVNVLCMN